MTNRGTVQSVILVTGATGKVGGHVVSQLLDTSAAVRALTRNSEAAGLPDDVVHGDLFVPDTLDARLDGVEVVFLVLPFLLAEAAPSFLDAVTKHARRIVWLSSEGAGHDLEQQTNVITARIAAKLAA
jgi:uncharacterized protein YbjT (DUF2867 family)